YVDIKTWKWRSKDAYQKFEKIGGIDCSGFVQRVQQQAFKKAGIKYPITQGRTSTSGLWSKKYTDEINPGVKPPPPPDIRPGDMILLDYGHNRYGHSMIYKGKDAAGNLIVIQMGATAEEAILPAHKYQYYKGTYRMKGMDQVRKNLTA
ncbi:MAG: NlpC/P60 family protein, partial [Candidatus Rifleibacteriota bacterium]